MSVSYARSYANMHEWVNINKCATLDCSDDDPEI